MVFSIHNIAIFGDIYYQSCEIYGDDPDEMDDAIEMMANSSESWSLCDSDPPFKVIPYLASSRKNNTNRKWIMIGR